MVALFLFVIATVIGLILFDQYVHENIYRSQSRIYVEEEGLVDRTYFNTSIFSVLGFSRDEIRTFSAFRDHFRNYAEVSSAMKRTGMELIRLMVGIDFSASNEWQGRRTFKGECLHALKGSSVYNPYQKVIYILGHALQPLLQGYPISAFGFSDMRVRDQDVFPLKESGAPCTDFMDLLECYTFAARRVQLSGPTCFDPIIRQAMNQVEKNGTFHVLLIVTDGQLRHDDKRSKQALIDASHMPLSIVTIGVGDGPWLVMEEWDDHLSERCFDNFQFVSFHHVIRSARNPEAALALHALMEIPDQYQTMIEMGYISR